MASMSIRRGLGLGWFCSLSVLIAGSLISMDYEIGSLQSALTTHLAGSVLVATPIALMAVWPLIVFRRRQWLRGLLAAFVLGVVSYMLLWLWTTSPVPPTFQQSLWTVFVASVCWVLIALPTALFLRRS